MLPQARVSWDAVAFLEPEQPVPRQEWGGAEGMGEMRLQRSPLPWSPVNGTPISRSGGGRSESSVKPRTPRLRSSHWAGRALTCHLVSESPRVRLPPAAPLLGAALPQYPSTLRSTVQGGLGMWGSAG